MRFLRTGLKVAVSVGLLSYLIHYIGVQAIYNEFTKIIYNGGVIYIFYAFLMALLSIGLMTQRWHVLLKSYGLNPTRPQLFSYYLIGLFFNNFLPSAIGGDIVRIYKVIDGLKDRTVGFASVIIERLMGVAATLFMAFFALLLIWQEFNDPRLLYASGTLLVIILLFFYALIRNRPFQLMLRVFEKITFFKIGEKFSKLFQAIHFFRNRRRILVLVFMFSFLSQSAIVFLNYFIALALSVQINLSYLFIVVPVTIVLTMLPSINGIGVRELGFVGLLAEAGIAGATAMSISFLNLIIPMIISVAGAVLFIIQKNKPILEDNDGFKTIS